MKILQIVNPVIPFPAVTIGGKERVVEYLIDELLEDGHEITLMGHNDSKVHPSVKFIPIGTYLDQKNILLKIWYHILFNKYDVIHNHGRLIYFLPVIWSKIRKIHTFHMAELGTKSFYRFLKLKPINLILSPCGKWMQDKFKDAFTNWQYVNNGLPINKYIFKNLPLNIDAPLVIICRIGAGKGILHAIEIAKKSNKNLLIAGKIGDYPHEINWFNEHIKTECNDNLISFIGPVDDLQKENLLNSAAALLIPTIDSEAFNTTMIEANACGCPVISYDKFCFSEFIEDGINGFKGKEIEDLVHAVSQLHLISRAKCRATFEKKYTSKIMKDNYTKIY